MTTTMCRTGCSRSVEDAYLCKECTATLDEALEAIPGVVQDLELAVARQSRFSGERIGARSTSTPLPIDWNASIMLDALRNTLVSWVRHLEVSDWPADTLPAMATWLRQRMERVRNVMACAELYEEITECVAACRRQVDRPADRWFAGLCQCETELYAVSGAPMMTCRGCGTHYKVDDWKAYLSGLAEDMLVTAADASSALSAWDRPVAVATIYKWAERKRLVRKGVDWRGRPTYRLGDIRALAESMHAKERTAS